MASRNWLELSKEIIALFNKVIVGDSNNIASHKIDKDNVSLVGLFCKSFKHYKAISLLCEHGYGQDAQVLTRVLLEAYYLMKYMDEPVKKADKIQRNMQYAHQESFDLEKMINNLRNDLGISCPDKVDDYINEMKNKAKADVDNPGEWGRNIYVIAKAIDELDSYREHYAYLSTIVHSTAFCFRLYYDNNKSTFECVSSPAGTDDALTWATLFFLRSALIYQKHFGGFKSWEIEAILKKQSLMTEYLEQKP